MAIGKITEILRQVLDWWNDRSATQGLMVYINPVVPDTKGADKRWSYYSDGDDVRTRLVGEHRAAIGFRGPLVRARDVGETDNFGDLPDLELRAGASDDEPGELFLRGGTDPSDDPAFPTAAFIIAHKSKNDPNGAEKKLHLGCGTDGLTMLGVVAAYLNSGLEYPHFTLEQANALPNLATGTELEIIDSDVDEWGDVISGGGFIPVKAHFNGKEWTVAAK